MESQKQLVVVLGMHRSGTSAITRALQVLGVNLGGRLMEAEYDNPTGFWEDLDIHNFHTELYRSLKMRWDRLSLLSADELAELRTNGMHQRAVDLIISKSDQRQHLGLKHPKMAKTFPFWSEVFPDAGYYPKYLLAIRHPLSVARSLSKRNGIDKEYACLLWLSHVLPILNAPADASIVVDYDFLMEDPEREIGRIADRFKMKVDPGEMVDYREKFLTPELRHAHYSLSDLESDSDIHPLVSEVYRQALQFGTDRKSLGDSGISALFKRWREEFSALTPLLDIIERTTFERNDLGYSLRYATNELHWMDASASWRFTKPLRSLLSTVRKASTLK